MQSTDNTPEAAEDCSFELVDVAVGREQRRKVEYFFNAICPHGHDKPDQYSITVTYRAQKAAIEVDSFKEWLDGYSDREIAGEEVASEVYDEVREVFGRSHAEVTLYQTTEVGVTQTIEVGSCR